MVPPLDSTTRSGSQGAKHVTGLSEPQAVQTGKVLQHVGEIGHPAPSGIAELPIPTSSSLTAKDAWNPGTVTHSDLYRGELKANLKGSVSCMIAEGGIGFAFPAKCMETWLGLSHHRQSYLAIAKQQAQTMLVISCLGEVCLDGQPTAGANRSWRRAFLEHGSVYTLKISSSRAGVAITLSSDVAGLYLDSLAAGYPVAKGNTPQKARPRQAGHWKKHESNGENPAIYTHVIQLGEWCALLG